jgi:phosphoribosylglycinamide formyltransferase 1
MNGKVSIGVLASGGGSNFEALACAVREGKIPGADIGLLIVNKPGAGALDRAKRLGIEALVLEPKSFPDRASFYDRAADAFDRRGVRLICLAGFLLKLEPNFLRRFPGRVMNIHPALLPKHGGAGMWGHHVHEAVLAAGEKESGCTVHWVDEEYDHGPALAQARVPVLPGDTPDALAARILEEEHRLYPATVAKVVNELLKVKP